MKFFYRYVLLFFKYLKACWQTTVLIITPVAFSWLLLLFDCKEAKCAYVVVVMGVYYCTECIPIPITAMMPVMFLPALGLATTEEASMPYLNDANMMFLGSLTLALAIEKVISISF